MISWISVQREGHSTLTVCWELGWRRLLQRYEAPPAKNSQCNECVIKKSCATCLSRKLKERSFWGTLNMLESKTLQLGRISSANYMPQPLPAGCSMRSR